MSMVKFFVGRLGKALLVIFSIAALNFILIHLAPGDPASVLAGEAGASDPAYVDAIRTRFGLDQPLWKQLLLYLGQVAQLDLGFSYSSQLPVSLLILERLPATLLLMGASFCVSLAFDLGFGILAASVRFYDHARWLDTLIMTLALVLYATPLFWLALMMIILFSVHLGWLPAFGMETVGAKFHGIERLADIGQHLVLPTLTLSFFFMSVYVRLVRAGMMEVMMQDHVRTAFAKGVKASGVMRRHVLRNALLPVVTFAGLQLGQVAGGGVLIETVFAWPGIGRLMFDALLQRDYQLLLGVFLVTSATVIFFNLVTDAVYRLVDPRIRLGGGVMTAFWKLYSRNLGGVIGLILILLILTTAVLAPLVFPNSPWAMRGLPLLPPFEEGQFPLGTDMLGRDIAAGLAYGARVSLLVGTVSTLCAVIAGVGIGAFAGYFGGWIEDGLMRFTEFFQTIPQLAMAVVLVAIFTPSLVSIVTAITLVSWPPVARLVRAEVLSLREREFVQASVVLGRPTYRILLDDVLPNALPPVIVMASLMVATAILTEAALAFLGLGDRDYMSWGFMIGASRTMLREAPWLSLIPGLAILITVLAVNLLGEGLNDALNPRLRERGE